MLDDVYTVTATVEVRVSDDRPDTRMDAYNLVRDALRPLERPEHDWGWQFAIVIEGSPLVKVKPSNEDISDYVVDLDTNRVHSIEQEEPNA